MKTQSFNSNQESNQEIRDTQAAQQDKQATENRIAKRALRQTHRRARRELPFPKQHHHAVRLMHNVLSTHLLLRYQRFALYLASDGEITPAPLASKLLEFSKHIAMPCLRRSEYNPAGKRSELRMHFAPCTQTTPMLLGAYNLTEPTAPARPKAFHPDVIFQPLVAFDRRGTRLGMGGGFYDRYNPRVALRIGLAHSQQEVTKVPADVWDIPLDAVITERAILPFNARAETLLLGRSLLSN